MKRLMVVTFVLAVVGLLTVAVYGLDGPIASQPRTLKDGRIAIGSAMTITQPGSYVLVRNIEQGQLIVEADDVEIDFNGFRLNGASPALLGSNIRGLAVHDGTIGPNIEEGIKLVDVEDVRLYRLRTYSTFGTAIKIVGGQSVVVEDCQINGGGLGSTAYSLSVMGTNIVVRRNQISNGVLNAGSYANSGCTGCSVVENQVSGYSAFYVGGRCGVISGNVLSGNTEGMVVFGDGFLIASNTIREALGIGLWILGDDNVYRGNIVRANGTVPHPECSGIASGDDFCDIGTNNTSHGDNYMPGQM